MRKSLICILSLIVVLIATVGFAQEKTIRPFCPVTKMAESCLGCHVVTLREGKPTWALREIKPDAHLVYPQGTQLVLYKGEIKGYFFLNSEISISQANQIRDFFDYLRLHDVKSAILDIHSPGGSLFASWRIKGLIDEFIADGGIVETLVRGYAASGASILFVAGSKGYRKINPQAELMFHELYSFKFIDISTPSDKEDEARILRHFQNTITQWLATKCKLSKDELDSRMRKKEFWINGEEAVEYGMADKLLGK